MSRKANNFFENILFLYYTPKRSYKTGYNE